jgi:hypothetical protein
VGAMVNNKQKIFIQYKNITEFDNKTHKKRYEKQCTEKK